MALAVIGLGLAVATLVVGVAFGTVVRAHRRHGRDPGPSAARLAGGGDLAAESAETIVLDLRLPRVLTAMAVGAALSLAGATYQGLLRNPLADPYVLGTASGAALGAAVALLVPIQIALLGPGPSHLLAFVGALVAVAVVYRVSRLGALAGRSRRCC